MKKIIKIIVPSIIMFSFIFLWRNGKDILNGLFIAFPIMYMLLGLISNDKEELLINLTILSITFLIPINLWFHMGTCIDWIFIYNILSIISYLIKEKIKRNHYNFLEENVKKIVMILLIIILLVLLFPIKNQLKDGGTVEYKAILYKISKVSKLISVEEMEAEGKVKNYDKGIIFEVLGFEIFNNVE